MNTLQGHPAVPSENWDDDFEFQQASSSSSPNSKRDPSSSYPTIRYALPTQSSLMDFEPSLPPPGNRISTASSHFTEDWDAESSSNIPLEHVLDADMNSSSIGYGHRRSLLTTNPPETPLSQLAASSLSSDSQSLDVQNTYSYIRNQPAATENWDDDFEDSMDSPVRPAFHSHSYPRPGIVSLDEEMASTPTKATAGSSALKIRGAGSGLRCVVPADAKDDNDERPESWDEEFELDALREQEERERSLAKMTSEQGLVPSPGKRRRFRKNKQSVGGYSTYSSSDEDFGDNDGTPVRPSAFHSRRLSFGFDDSEFGMGDKEEDKTVTARSRRRPFSRLLSSRKTGSPPPPVPSIPSQRAGPSFPSPPPSSALSAPPQTSPPSSSQPSQSRLFQRSNSSVFSIPLPNRSASSTSNSSVDASNRSSSAHSRSQSHQIHSYNAQSAGADGTGSLETSQANGSLTHLLGLNLGGGKSRSSFLGILPPSTPVQEKKERRRLRKKSRPQSAHGARRSGVDDDPVDEFGMGGGEGNGSATVVARGQRSGKQSFGGDIEWMNLTEGRAHEEEQDIEITSDSRPLSPRTPATPPPLHSPHQVSGKPVPSTPSGSGLSSPASGGLLSRIGSVKRWGRRKRESTTPSEVEAAEKGKIFPSQETEDITPRPPSSLSSFRASIAGTPSSSSQHNGIYESRPPLSNPGWFSRATISSRTQNGSTSDLTSFDPEMERRSMYTPPPDSASHKESSKLVKRKSLGFVPLKGRMSHTPNNSIGGGYDGRWSPVPRGRDDVPGGSTSDARPLSMQSQSRHASYSTPSSSNTGRESVDDLGSGERSKGKSYSKSRERESKDDEEAEGGRGLMGSVRKLSFVGRHKRTKSGLSLASVAAAMAAPTLAQPSGAPITTGSDPPSNALPGSSSGGVFKTRDANVKAPEPPSPEVPTIARTLVYSASPLTFSKGLTLDQNDGVHPEGYSMSEAAKSTSPPAQNSLLPPIELHPPSPPRTSREPRSNTTPSTHEESTALRIQTILSTASASPTSPVSLIYSSPSRITPASPGGNDADRLNSEHDGFPRAYGLPPISPAKRSILGRSPKAPGSSQAASLGRSTGGPAALLSSSVHAGSALISVDSSGTTALRRNNSLGDLKIPARISQAQVGLRRDLGLVKEFAANVDQLKDLQKIYHTLLMEVQHILDTQAHMYAQQQQRSQQKQLQPQSPSRAASPSFFANISSRKTRNRSNTNSTIAALSSSTSTAIQVPVPAQPIPATNTNSTTNLAYKQLASMFYTINSKYRISWECAELLIELGSGPNAHPPPSTGPSSYRYKFAGSASGSGSGAGAARPSTSAGVPSTSVSAPAMQSTSSGEGKKGSRERAVTLTGEESKPPASPPYSGAISSSASTANVASIPGSSTTAGPPMPSPPSLGWHASTGRHDLSHRQLSLLKEMLNNSDSVSASGLAGLLDMEMGETPLHARAIPEESRTSLSLNINREWRWGDAMSSTVTLPSEESNNITAMSPSGFGMGAVAAGLAAGIKGKGKRRLVGISGLRSILRSLKRSHSDHHQVLPTLSPAPPHAGAGQEAPSPVQPSTTSLTTDDSVSDGPGKHLYPHPLLSLPPPSTPPSDGNRKAEGSTGPESDGVQSRPSSPYQSGSLPAAKPSPRRPSIASVFRIGKSGKIAHAASSGTTSPYTANVSLESVIDEDTGTTIHTSGGGKLRKKPPKGSRAGQIRADVFGDSASSVGEEEDWDRIDSASDLDIAVGRTGNEIPTDVFATVRKSGGKGVKEHLMGRGRSPYMQKRGVGVFTGATSAERIPSTSANRQESPQRRAVSGSHSSTSIWDNPSSNGNSHQPGSVASSRPSRLSNVEEVGAGVKKAESSQESQPAPMPTTSPPSSAGPVKSIVPAPTAASPTPRPKTAKSRGSRGLSGPPDPKLAMTPENIKPLLENAREVRARLSECVAEIKALLASATASSMPTTTRW